jgi:hypothetical protein
MSTSECERSHPQKAAAQSKPTLQMPEIVDFRCLSQTAIISSDKYVVVAYHRGPQPKDPSKPSRPGQLRLAGSSLLGEKDMGCNLGAHLTLHSSLSYHDKIRKNAERKIVTMLALFRAFW